MARILDVLQQKSVEFIERAATAPHDTDTHRDHRASIVTIFNAAETEVHNKRLVRAIQAAREFASLKNRDVRGPLRVLSGSSVAAGMLGIHPSFDFDAFAGVARPTHVALIALAALVAGRCDDFVAFPFDPKGDARCVKRDPWRVQDFFSIDDPSRPDRRELPSTAFLVGTGITETLLARGVRESRSFLNLHSIAASLPGCELRSIRRRIPLDHWRIRAADAQGKLRWLERSEFEDEMHRNLSVRSWQSLEDRE
ncbi:MAG: hypothetical protein KDC14_03545 [Planctomycetes bacterium]|nr:hypothetical protein [Planctomycetota bacterium]